MSNGYWLPGYRTVETDERAPGGTAFASRFRWRAERRCRRYNSYVRVPFYRWEVIEEDGRWKVVAFQNVAVPE